MRVNLAGDGESVLVLGECGVVLQEMESVLVLEESGVVLERVITWRD